MSNVCDEVLAFFREWKTSAEMFRSFESRFTADTVWENVGLSRTVGAREAIALMNDFNNRFEMVGGVVRVDHIAASQNTVLTERVDTFYRSDGSVALSIRVMGILHMDGPQILEWRDYFDTMPFLT